ncbi:tyrosine-type recombinase/integrase [Pontibacter sp. JAM-7]|uniref:tyrosine-type recombinase/integrase n=1 Tax=Pontibacter sp. JAM-7 TaxID=3366581 RepID=UPI003AF9739C
MAYITKRGEKWFAQVQVDNRRKSKSFPTKGHARQWALEMENQLSNPDQIDESRTLADLLDRYAEEVTPTKRSAESEIKRIIAFKKRPIASERLCDLKRENFEHYITERLKSVQGSSINRELNTLSNCFTYARRWRWMTHNPLEDMKRPANPKHRDRRILPEEIEQVLIALNYNDDEPVEQKQQAVAVMFLLAIETAMRSGEMCNLTRENIHLDRRYVHLPMTKNGMARDVPLSSRAVELLEKVIDLEGLFNVTDRQRDAIFRKALARTAIEGLTFHDTRHEAITRLSKKLGVLELARMVGHRDIKQLMTYYNSTAEELARSLD